MAAQTQKIIGALTNLEIPELLPLPDVRVVEHFEALIGRIDVLLNLRKVLAEEAELQETARQNILLLRQLAGQLIETILTDKCQLFSDDVMQQVQAWQRDTFLRDLRSTYRQQQDAGPLSRGWIVRAAPELEFS